MSGGDVNWKVVLKIICLTAVSAPATMAAVAGLTITPLAAAVMALLALVGGLTLSELQPGLGSQVSDDMIRRITDEIMRREGRERAAR